MRSQLIWIAGIAALFTACTREDRAAPAYAACVEAEAKGDVLKADEECSKAVKADPTSPSGEKAAVKLKELAPAVKAEKDKRDAERREREEADRKARAERQRAAVAEARRKVSMKYWGAERDGSCTSGRKPPYRVTVEGGTFEENEMVATSEGCVHLFEKHGTTSPNDNEFCCPKAPRLGLF